MYVVKISEIKDILLDKEKLIAEFTEFIKSDTVKKYSFDINEISKIKIDLSFFSNLHRDLNVVDYVKNQVKVNPEITPLIHVFKRYLNLNRLNSSFNGGLSSYSLLLMIIAYVRYPKTSSVTNLGTMIIGFFEFYGKYFNFNQFVIDVANFK